MYSKYARTRRESRRISIYYILIALMIVLILVGMIISSFNDHTYVATVNDKDRIVQTNNSYYLIFCKDDEGNYYEFQNSDSLFRLKFDSSNVYNRIEIGKKYRFTVVGYRIDFLSCYENIIEFEEMQE